MSKYIKRKEYTRIANVLHSAYTILGGKIIFQKVSVDLNLFSVFLNVRIPKDISMAFDVDVDNLGEVAFRQKY